MNDIDFQRYGKGNSVYVALMINSLHLKICLFGFSLRKIIILILELAVRLIFSIVSFSSCGDTAVYLPPLQRLRDKISNEKPNYCRISNVVFKLPLEIQQNSLCHLLTYLSIQIKFLGSLTSARIARWKPHKIV